MKLTFTKTLFKKIKNKEDLDYNELQYIERSLLMQEIYTETLNMQLGFTENTFGLEVVDKRTNKVNNKH